MELTEDQFINCFVNGRVEIETDVDTEVIGLPASIYKKGSGELNAERVMILVLKARSLRKANPPKVEAPTI